VTTAANFVDVGHPGSVSFRGFTVSCADHGEMLRDHPRMAWKCPDGACPAWLPDTEVYRLVKGAPGDSPDPVPIVVT
jgi:hypothetical protein